MAASSNEIRTIIDILSKYVHDPVDRVHLATEIYSTVVTTNESLKQTLYLFKWQTENDLIYYQESG